MKYETLFSCPIPIPLLSICDHKKQETATPQDKLLLLLWLLFYTLAWKKNKQTGK